MAYELRLIEDNLHAGHALTLGGDGINRVLYVAWGSVEAGGKSLGVDSGCHARGAVRIAAGDTGAAVWRYELSPAGSKPTLVAGADGRSNVKLAVDLKWPIADQLLMRADSVAFPPGGCAYLHTHQGSGIRCLIEGGMRIDTDGHSTSYAPGGAWFEAGPIPVFAQAAADRPSRFVRVMVLPQALLGKSSISYVRAEDKDKPKSQSYKGYVDTAITL